MTRLILSTMIIAGAAVLVVALANGTIRFNLNDLPDQQDGASAYQPVATRGPTESTRVTPPPPQGPALQSADDPTPAPTETPGPPPAAVPTPTLTPPEVFTMLDRGEITVEEAVALLGEKEPWEPSTAAPAPTIAPTSPPSPTPDAMTEAISTEDPPERGSEEWSSQLEYNVHVLVNLERRNASLGVLGLDYQLAAIARGHSQDMVVHDYFAHENRAGQSASARGLQAGYRCVKKYVAYYTDGIAENLFQTSLYSSAYYVGGIPVRKNYMSIEKIARQAVSGWMDSPGHRENILKASYDRQGIGVAVSPDEKVYVTQNFC